MPGNLLGPKSKVQYTSDAGIDYVLRVDDDLIASNSGLVLGDVGQPHPVGWAPRGVHCQAVVGGKTVRKFLICGTSAAGLYATNLPQTVTIDGVDFTTTGRKGEVQRFL